MQAIHALIEANILVAIGVLAVAFVVLALSADIFVTSAAGIAVKFKIPRLVIGIVLVSLGTTAPELTVSLVSALKGQPEIALGNAIGSVICDDGLALPLCAFFSAGAIPVMRGVLATSGIFLLVIQVAAMVFILPDATLTGTEGMVLVGIFVVYTATLLWRHKKHPEDEMSELEDIPETVEKALPALVIAFVVALAALILASDFIVTSATTIALALHVPDAIIAVTLVAFGTSIPEIATCVTAARKGEGALAVGNIIGADVLNICWVAGASAIANDLIIPPEQAQLMVPSMTIIVLVMLGLLRWKHTLTKRKGAILLVLYIAYLAVSFWRFPPTIAG